MAPIEERRQECRRAGMSACATTAANGEVETPDGELKFAAAS
jgi:hypothetical protein